MNWNSTAGNWETHFITDPQYLIRLWAKADPIDFAIDTETDGLMPVTAKPFLVIFGFTPKEYVTKKSIVVAFEPTPELMFTMYNLAGSLNFGYAHNAKFDLHMMANGFEKYPHKNILDTMTIARLVLEAKPEKAGGPLLGLKPLAKKFIEDTATDEQSIIKSFKARIANDRKREGAEALKAAGFGNSVYNMKYIDKMHETGVYDLQEELPPEVYQIWKEWDAKYPAVKGISKIERVTYKDIYDYSEESKQAMIKYAYSDVKYTIILARKFMPYIVKLGMMKDLMKEQKAMYALWDSERVGIKVDTKYIQESKVKLRKVIKQRRIALQQLLGDNYNAAEFAASPTQIKVWLKQQDPTLPAKISTAATALEEFQATTTNPVIKEVITKILGLRAIMKKYSTDLLGFEHHVHNGRRYTSYKQNGTVTGRLSNNMQQIPNKGFNDDQGVEIFHPRKAVIPSTDEGYTHIAYLDYSQVEIRIQAHYTWIATNGTGDEALLRMYVPFNCYYIDGDSHIKWDPNNQEHIHQPFISGHDWLDVKTHKPWVKTDMHLLTARQAFPELEGLPDDDPLVKNRRKQAKGINFAIQYGAGKAKVQTMAETPEIGAALYKANKTAFQGLVAYGNMLRKFYNRHGYVENIYGRKYKLNMYTHRAANYAVQGSGADLLKQKIAATHEYLLDKKSRLIHNIHDELQFEIHKSELYVIKELAKIMDDTGNLFIVPILSDIETTTTSWKDKQEGIINET